MAKLGDKKRGARSNPTGRFEAQVREAFDDGWGTLEDTPPSIATSVSPDRARSLIVTNDSPDVPFERSVNPYKGCEHGCIYCFARPSHNYLGLSSGQDFETRLFYKDGGVEALRREFAKPSYRCEPLVIGANTDAYQPIERELELTRGILELASSCGQPVSLITKSALIRRDRDLLAEMAQRGLSQVFISLTTLSSELAGVMEPRASSPAARVQTIRLLREAGIPVGILCSPIIPGLNDHEIEELLASAADAGAQSASHMLLRLPYDIKDLFIEWLQEHFAERAERVLSLIRQTRRGKLYQSAFGERMSGSGPYAELIGQRFELARRANSLDTGLAELDCSAFTRPTKNSAQLSLF